MAVSQIDGKISNIDLFDESSGYEDEGSIKLAPGLTLDEINRATTLYRLFNELWGLCIVTGDPGTGKDLFANAITYWIKRYFPWKRILRDEKPRSLYGHYAGLFNETVLSEDLGRMRELAVGLKTVTAQDAAMERAADDWVTEKGQVLLKNSCLYLTEYKKYNYRREPHNPMNKTMGSVNEQKRHLDCLIIGTVQDPRELDRFTCLPWVDWRVVCTRSKVNKTGFTYFVYKVKYDKKRDILDVVSQPFAIPIDGGKPRKYIGNGKIVVKKPRYTPESEEERVVLEVLTGGVSDYETLLDYIDEYGDMTQGEILTTLKNLKFTRRKRVIDYPCFFSIYNSKSAPQIQTSVRMEDTA